MNYGKKMVLTPAQTEPLLEKRQSELDIEMSRILNNIDLDDFDKMRLYNITLSKYLGYSKNEHEQVPVNDVSTETENNKIPKFELQTPVKREKVLEFLDSFNIAHPTAASILESPRELNKEELSFIEQLSSKKSSINSVLERLQNQPNLSIKLFSDDITPVKTGNSPMREIKKKIKNGYVPQLSTQMKLRNNNLNNRDLDKTTTNWEKYNNEML